MASNRFVFSGLEELKAELRRLPAELAGEAGHIVEGAGNSAAVTIRTIYGKHRVTGNLQDRVTVAKESIGTYGAAVIVKSTAPHAWLFDNGSAARHYITVRGNKHPTGKMWGRSAPTHAFVRTMIAARRVMYEKLAAMLQRHGLIVTGKAA